MKKTPYCLLTTSVFLSMAVFATCFVVGATTENPGYVSLSVVSGVLFLFLLLTAAAIKKSNRNKMKTLQITERNARKLYKDATPEFKTTLEDTFGKDYFQRKATDCETYEEVCGFIGEQPVDEGALKSAGFTQDEIDYRKLKQITKAYNDGWVADYNDSNQQKWIPWLEFSPSGARFDVSLCSYSYAAAGRAARLCFRDEATSNAAGRRFTDLYARFINQ